MLKISHVVRNSCYKMENVILLVVFNYSTYVARNVELLKKIYGNHFKKIVFYSDLPNTNVPNVDYLNIQKGYYTHGVFDHFNIKYKTDIDNSSGIFYIMDDCIINTTLLKKLDITKPITGYHVWKTGDDTQWQWPRMYDGNMKALNASNKRYQDNTTYVGAFSDYFYVPRSLWTDDLVRSFKIFYDYNIFLEIAVPTVLRDHNIQAPVPKDKQVDLWGDARNKIFIPNWIQNQFKDDVVIIHPIKLGNPAEMDLLSFMIQHQA